MYVKTGECSIQGAIMVTQSARDTVHARIPRLENSDVSPFLPTPWTKCPMSQPSATKHFYCHTWDPFPHCCRCITGSPTVMWTIQLA